MQPALYFSEYTACVEPLALPRYNLGVCNGSDVKRYYFCAFIAKGLSEPEWECSLKVAMSQAVIG